MGQGEPHHGGARADTRGKTHGQWRWVQRSPSRRTYRRTRYRRGLRWAWEPEFGGTYCALHPMLLRLRRTSPALAPPMGSSPSGLRHSSLNRPPPKAPPIPSRPKRVPRARASHPARRFLGATPNLTPFAAHFRLHHPVWRWPVSCPFQASSQASPTNLSCAPVPTHSGRSPSTEAEPTQASPPDPCLPQTSPLSDPSGESQAPPFSSTQPKPLRSHTCWGPLALQGLLTLPAVAFPALVQLSGRLPLRACLRKERREDPPPSPHDRAPPRQHGSCGPETLEELGETVLFPGSLGWLRNLF